MDSSFTPLSFPFQFSAFNKKDEKFYFYTCRVMEKSELKKIVNFIYQQFCGLDFLTEEERNYFRNIKDLNQRSTQILELLKTKSNGKIQSFFEAGSPDDILNCTTYEDFWGSLQLPIEKGLDEKLVIGIEYKDQLVGIYASRIFDPYQFLSQPFEVPISDPVIKMVEELDRKFAQYLIHRDDGQIYRQLISNAPIKNKIAHIEYVCVDANFRGSNLLSLMDTFFLNLSYQIGYRIAFAESSGPISHHVFLREGYIPLLDCSVNFQTLEWNGIYPYKTLTFKSPCPGGDNMLLCVFNSIEVLLKKSNKLEVVNRIIEKDRSKKNSQKVISTGIFTLALFIVGRHLLKYFDTIKLKGN